MVPMGFEWSSALSFHLHRSRPFTDLNQPQSETLQDGKWEIERRLVLWSECATQKFS